jgi:hypothetical protein
VPGHLVQESRPERHAPHLGDVGLPRGRIVRVARRARVERDVELDPALGDRWIDLPLDDVAQVAVDAGGLGQFQRRVHRARGVVTDGPPLRVTAADDAAEGVALGGEAGDGRLARQLRGRRRHHDHGGRGLRGELPRRDDGHRHAPAGEGVPQVRGTERGCLVGGLDGDDGARLSLGRASRQRNGGQQEAHESGKYAHRHSVESLRKRRILLLPQPPGSFRGREAEQAAGYSV